ncbi:glycoside hydrolase family protein [Algihabitans albus]|uniref:hypothetical protein n=1 Tax=Algihabitans albus TaxID=2164067 RepID=UPI0013C317D4|nr:hypothetical protein [Algihabitans albus]
MISRLDREPFSKSYGSLDRTYWAWKFTDFPGARFQEAAYSLAKLYRLRQPANPLFEHPRALSWAKAIFANWASLQYPDGSFDEAYPYEHSLAATAFTGFYVGEAYCILQDQLEAAERVRLVDCFRKAGDWLRRNDETHGVLSNHLAAAAAALTVIAKITGDEGYTTRARHFLQRIYAHQSKEGWYEEYGGADPGYQTHGTFYLARIWQLTGDDQLLESLKKSVAFLKHFIHPDGSLGGEYGSRNTAFYFPAGFEILAPVCDDAASIAQFMRASVERQICVGLAAMDAYNLLPMLNNCLAAAEALVGSDRDAALTTRRKVSVLPCQTEGRWSFPDAGLFVLAEGPNFMVVGGSKGGVVKLFRRTGDAARLAASDCGWWVRLGKGVASSQLFDRGIALTLGSEELSLESGFVRVNQRLMTPWLFMAFRLFCLLLGRSQTIAYRVKALLVKVLVSRKRPVPLRMRRRIMLSTGRLVIEDCLVPEGPLRVDELGRGENFASIHMGSARYYQPSDLLTAPPRMERSPDLRALSAGQPVTTRLVWEFE